MTDNYTAIDVSIPDSIIMSELDDEAILLNISTNKYFGLDAVGTRMWHHLAASENVAEAFDHLLNEFDVDDATLRADIDLFLQNLANNGLIELRQREVAAA